MHAREVQIPLPRSWETFEDLCLALFRAIWKDPHAQKHGRRGQPQHGVDVYGSIDGAAAEFLGVQCKGKDEAFGGRASEAEILEELRKAEAFEPKLAHWTFATSAPSDAKLQALARKLSAERVAQQHCPVTILGWGDIQSLLLEHPNVLTAFYPEIASDLPALLAEVRNLNLGKTVEDLQAAIARLDREAGRSPPAALLWRPVTFGLGRDLGPALLGRPLGAADVTACPEIPEAKTVVAELKRAFSARLEGDPGAGKSVCALQAAKAFADEGWSVQMLDDARVDRLDWPPDPGGRTLFLIDDAHLMPESVLRHLEAQATASRLVLSTLNAVGAGSGARGAVVMDAGRAVKVIAAGLRSDRRRTLEVVQRIDDRIGDRPFDESLEHRFEAAEQAGTPWQFCFILGGGWRRAANSADAARKVGADLVLAAIALHQIASRDARADRPAIVALVQAAGERAETVDPALEWLAKERLILAPNDLRTPHQRFAVVVLARLLAGQDRPRWEAVGEMLNRTLEDPHHPLLGLRLLLDEWTRLDQSYIWTHLVKADRLQPLIARCWAAVAPEERTHAMMTLAILGRYIPGGMPPLVRGRETILRDWFSSPDHPSGYGIGHLTNTIRQDDEILASDLICAADPTRIAAALSAATPKTGYNLAEILSSTYTTRSGAWNARLSAAIDWPALIALGRSWPDDEGPFVYAKLCEVLVSINQARGLDMVEAFLPVAQRALARDPITAFHELDCITSRALHTLDLLGVYQGKYAPIQRQRRLAARLVSGIAPKKLAAQLSAIPKRDFQQAGFLLHFLAKVAPKTYDRTVEALEWNRLAETIGDDWGRMFHDAEVFLAVCSGRRQHREAVRAVIASNADRIEIMPPRLAVIAPEVAYRHVEAGRSIAIGAWGIDVRTGPTVVGYFAQDRPDLLDALLRPTEAATAKTLSAEHPSWFRDGTLYFRMLRQVAPECLDRILSHVDVSAAEKGWTTALTGKGTSRRTIAFLIEVGLTRSDTLGDLCRRLRERYPKRSKPGAKDLEAINLPTVREARSEA